MKKQILAACIGLPLLLVLVLLARTFMPTTAQVQGQAFRFSPDAEKTAKIMSAAVRYKTISFGRDKPVSAAPLLAFHRFLEKTFPLVHANLKREVISDYSLLYTWPGSRASLKPVILLGHLDVVPIVPGTQADWVHPPFSGKIADGYVWGRGTLDNKINIIGILSAAEYMLERGLAPQRSLYFAFGHDEEQGGLDGARAMAALLEERNVSAEFLIDEGGLIAQSFMPGLRKPVAVIAPAEKGIVTLHLSSRGKGGHSSMPPPQSSIGVLAAALARLEANQFPTDFSHTRAFLEAVADEMPFANRIIMKNLWLFQPLVMASFASDNQAQASMRTTTAVTMIDGGIKANVLPIETTAKVNFRILPGETPETVKQRVVKIINDPRVRVDYDGTGQRGMAPSPVSPIEGFGWDYLTSTIRDTAAPEDIIVAPRLLVAATDTRHYRKITPNHYRFTYMRLPMSDVAGIHGTNERISVATLANSVRFYFRLMSGL